MKSQKWMGILLLGALLAGLGCLESAEHGIQAKKRAEELGAIAALRAIYSAQSQYKMAKGKYAATLEELKKSGYPLPFNREGKKGAYTYKIRIFENGFLAVAIPNQKAIKGARAFGINDRGQILVDSSGKEPTSTSPLWTG